MELAGLAVAEATHKSFPLLKDVLVLVGPGNNGEYSTKRPCRLVTN